MIEVSSNEYWKKMPYHDALLYCQLLSIDGKNDWRMITNVEESLNLFGIMYSEEVGWYKEDIDEFSDLLDTYYVVRPVRDIP